jgi:predicted enzyme related to lactoylglutathione lyase
VAFYSAVLGCEFTLGDETGETYPLFTAPDGATHAIITDPAGNRAGLMADG